ncbi:unnamed protein product [Spirodela intermedia]|nr:unnamed protein product [Spirodela intermedia]CAA6673267.1 unnamed protein product [Spirodela intermedia]
MGNLRRLLQLVLSRNRLRGEVPRSIARCGELKILDLGSNRIAGLIPPEFGRLEALVKLDLSGNRLSGSLPGELSGLRQLEFLDVSRNNLTGGVPAALAGMGSMKELYLSGKPLGGRIPEIWEKLGALVRLGMPRAGLVGGIPSSMGGGVPKQFRRLEGTAKEIDLGNNLLGGRVPFSASFVAKVGGKLKLFGNPRLCLDGELAGRAGGGLGYLGLCDDRTQIIISHPPSSSGGSFPWRRRPPSLFFLSWVHLGVLVSLWVL